MNSKENDTVEWPDALEKSDAAACPVDVIVSTGIGSMFEDIVPVRKRMTDDEYRMRKMLAFAYEKNSGGLIYGDDGELQLQVNEPFIFIDFMRDTALEIETKISDIGLYRYAQSLKETEC